MTTTETFQQAFAANIAQLVFDAYNCGVLQYHPMTVAGITVTMTMFAHFNQLALQFNGRLISVSIFDEDDDATQYSSVQNLVADIID